MREIQAKIQVASTLPSIQFNQSIQLSSVGPLPSLGSPPSTSVRWPAPWRWIARSHRVSVPSRCIWRLRRLVFPIWFGVSDGESVGVDDIQKRRKEKKRRETNLRPML